MALGGFVETSGGYLIAYNQAPAYYDYHAPRGLRMAYVDKETLEIGHWGLIDDDEGYNISNPQLVATGLDGGYLLWQWMAPYTEVDDHAVANDNPSVDHKVYYARYQPTGGIGAVAKNIKASACSAELSDCQPIVWNGKVVWYVTDNSAPTFYTLDDSGVSAHQTTVAGVPNIAYASTQTVQLDGKPVTFHTYALKDENGNLTNYIRIRDLAPCLSGSRVTFLMWIGPGKQGFASRRTVTTTSTAPSCLPPSPATSPTSAPPA